MDHAVSQAQPLIDQELDFTHARFALADDDVDVMLFEPLQSLGELGGSEIQQLAIDARPTIAQASRAGDYFLVESFPAPHDGAENHHFFAAVRAGNPIKNLAAAQRADLPAALDAVLFADL